MLKALLERGFRKQEEVTGESADFVRDMYNAAPGGFWRFALFTPMAQYRKVLPKEAYAVAKIAAGHSEDCGPCLQTCVNLAVAAGVAPEIVRAAVTGETGAMDERTRVVYEFAQAVCAHDIRSEELRTSDREMVGQGRDRGAGACHRLLAPLPDGETRAGPRPGLLPRHHRPRNRAGRDRRAASRIIG